MQASPSMRELESVGKMSEADLDALPFGAIQLDGDGKVLKYNQTESDLTGRKKEKVIGRNFFTEVAPCTNVQGFAGRFRDGFARRDMHEIFPYRFDFQMAQREVTVTLFFSRQTESAWVFVRAAAS